MKTYLLPALKLTAALIILCAFIYPALIAYIGLLAPGRGDGVKLMQNGKAIGYENIGQKFSRDDYFHGRPSAVNYNAGGSAGSNKGASNPEYLALVKARIDTFLVHNPNIQKRDIPVDLVTASGSGLDPDISIKAAKIQVPRIAKARKRNEKELYEIIEQLKEHPLFGLGPEKINVLKLNIELNKKQNKQ